MAKKKSPHEIITRKEVEKLRDEGRLGELDQRLGEAIKKHGGYLSYALEELGIGNELAYRRIKANPELEATLREARTRKQSDLIDGAEDCLSFALSNRGSNLKEAVRASFFILNQLGRSRGYTPYRGDGDVKTLTIDSLVDEICKISRDRGREVIEAEIVSS